MASGIPGTRQGRHTPGSLESSPFLLSCNPTSICCLLVPSGSPYNGKAYCEPFPALPAGGGSQGTHVAGASSAEATKGATYLAQVGHATVSRANFDNIGWALLAVFQILTVENFNDLMVRSAQ
jgi:hypothetical protein